MTTINITMYKNLTHMKIEPYKRLHKKKDKFNI